MAFLPRLGAIGLGLSLRVSRRLSHPAQLTAFRVTPSTQALFASTQTQDTFEKYKEKCCSDPAHFKAGLIVEPENPLDRKHDKHEAHYVMSNPVWTEQEANEVDITHEKPSSVCTWTAYLAVMTMRRGFDFFSGYTIKSYLKTLDERDMLRRCIFLETVAGVPGFAAAMIRHLQSLRRMQRDNGWIHTLLEEAENERMHLLTFLQLRNPGPILRASVAATQIIFVGMFSIAYLISPHFCHRCRMWMRLGIDPAVT